MNAWGNHWIALKIDMTKKYIATACSLNNDMKQLAQGVLQMISSQHKPASAFEHISVKVPHQKNAVDCGPLSCLFMLFLAHNNIIRSTTMDYDSEFTAVAMRLRIAADIFNKTLTPLVTQ
jgi:Ulp1 family protease